LQGFFFYMSNKIEILSQKFNKLDIFDLAKQICQDIETTIIDYNQEQLQKYGKDSNNELLPLPYAEMTIKIKTAKGQPTDRITLYDEGDFQNAFYVKYTNTDFSLWSTDGKTEKLVFEWGKNIFGLTDENLTKLIRKDIYPKLIEIIRSKI
jgi:hypothetical protein